jgi:hypothetical protein
MRNQGKMPKRILLACARVAAGFAVEVVRAEPAARR